MNSETFIFRLFFIYFYLLSYASLNFCVCLVRIINICFLISYYTVFRPRRFCCFEVQTEQEQKNKRKSKAKRKNCIIENHVDNELVLFEILFISPSHILFSIFCLSSEREHRTQQWHCYTKNILFLNSNEIEMFSLLHLYNTFR